MAFPDLDALREGAQMIPPIAAPFQAEAFTRGAGEGAQGGRGDGHAAGVFELGLRALRISLRLIAERPKGDHAFFQRWVIQIGNTGFDRLIEPLQPKLGFGRPLVQLGDMLAATLGLLLTTVEDRGQNFL